MAEQFYDVANKPRTDIYRAYIRRCLANTADDANVIHLTSAEFTGPLHFMQFWLDTVADWEKETGKKPLVGLSATKDVQDAILVDPVRSKIVDVIDIQYWWYQPDGTPYAPQGGKNLAPRQHERVIKHKGTSFEQVVRAAREYREKYPDKAVICSGNGLDPFGWAQLFGGASLANLPCPLDERLRSAIAAMRPVLLPNDPQGISALGDEKGNFLVYGASSDMKMDGRARRWVNAKSGRVGDEKPEGPAIAWFVKQ
jgi:hypothetical protein